MADVNSSDIEISGRDTDDLHIGRNMADFNPSDIETVVTTLMLSILAAELSVLSLRTQLSIEANRRRNSRSSKTLAMLPVQPYNAGTGANSSKNLHGIHYVSTDVQSKFLSMSNERHVICKYRRIISS